MINSFLEYLQAEKNYSKHTITAYKNDLFSFKEFISSNNVNVFGTFMDGENIYHTELPNSGIVVMGNEANGISKTIKENIDRKITIPQFGKDKRTESLNVATATSIVLSEFRRRLIET